MSLPALSQFERLVMPGKLANAHAEFESECGSCHERAADKPQRSLCLDCHSDITTDIEQKAGFHGRLAAAHLAECAACHTDHEGRDADILGLESGIFTHTFSDFPLHGSHSGLACQDCHSGAEKFRDTPATCSACHTQDDFHMGVYGSQCALCHNDESWEKIVFDHTRSNYPLTGRHAKVACGDCHVDSSFEKTPKQCANCHGVDDVHGGSNGDKCQQCHTTATWKQFDFDHLQETGFSLTAGHGDLQCQDCHTRTDFKDDLEARCVSCHQSDDDHLGQNGRQCQDCHQTTAWTENHFDHSVTQFHLLGSHKGLRCSSCHKQSIESPLPSDCRSCHTSEDIHANQLGTRCDDCHNTVDWKSQIAFDHDLTPFPLTGLHASAVCEACHQSGQFHDTQTTCSGCHSEDDIHEGSLGNDCAHCHNTNAWSAWSFDHTLQTHFALEGAHRVIECTACHNDPNQKPSDASSTCANCHKSDDVHDGEFGPACGRCHNSRTFQEIERL